MAALDVGGDPVADHRHPLGGGDSLAGQLEQVALRLAADLGRRAARRLDRGEDRAGAGPGAAGHRHRRVATGCEQRRAALQCQRRCQKLLVVEVAMAGDDDNCRFAAGLAFEQLQPRRAQGLLEGRCADRKRAPIRPGVRGGEARGRFPGGYNSVLGHRDPGPPQPLRIRRCEPARVVGDEGDLPAACQQLPQRLGCPRHHFPPNPDHTVEVDQETVEFVRQCHPAQAT